MIQYAAFFGSIQIFSYLKSEGAKLTSSLWMHAVHGKKKKKKKHKYCFDYTTNQQIIELFKAKSIDNAII